MARNLFIFLGLVLALMAMIEGTNNNTSPVVRIVSGAYARRISNVLVYSSSAPLVYELQFNMSETNKYEDLPNEPCPENRENECNVISGIEEYILDVESKLQLIEDSLRTTPFSITFTESNGQLTSRRNRRSNSTQVSERQRKPRHIPIVSNALGEFYSFCCDLVTTQQFDGLFTTQRNLKNTFNKLKQSIITDHSNIVVIQKSYKDFSSNVTQALDTYRQAIQKLMARYKEMALNETSTLNFISTFYHKMTILTFQLAQAQMKTAEIMHFNDILTHCRSQLLPLSAVGIDELSNDLMILQREVQKHDHELVIPPIEAMKYYNYKLASCSFSKKKIMITVKAPLRRQREAYEIHQLINIPFVYDYGSLCTIQHQPTYLAVSDTDVISIQGTSLQSCTPAEGICYVPQNNRDPQEGSHCSRLIIQGAHVSELKKACQFTCTQTPDSPFVTQLDHHRFVLTNYPKGTAVYCEDMKTKITERPTFVPPTKYGSTEVAIPCNCYIRIPAIPRLIRPSYPCPESPYPKPMIHHIIPSHWAKVNVAVLAEQVMAKSYSQHLNVYSFDNFDDILNKTWSFESTLNITAIDQLLNIQLPEVIHKLPTISSLLLYIWNIPLSISVVYLYWRVFQPKFNMLSQYIGLSALMRQADAANVDIPVQIKILYDIAEIVIWIFIILACICLIMIAKFILGYYIHKRRIKRSARNNHEFEEILPMKKIKQQHQHAGTTTPEDFDDEGQDEHEIGNFQLDPQSRLKLTLKHENC